MEQQLQESNTQQHTGAVARAKVRQVEKVGESADMNIWIFIFLLSWDLLLGFHFQNQLETKIQSDTGD